MHDQPMTFTEHLGELRSRLVRSVLAVGIAFAVAYGFHEPIFQALADPVLTGLRAHGIYSLQALQVTETITVYLQLSLIAGLFLAAPYVLWELWSFVGPGLLPDEKKYVVPVIGLVSAFFLLGVVFCYFVFLPMVVEFLVGFTVESGTVSLVPTVDKTFSLTLTFLLVFGLVFELPLLMFFLSLLGVVRFATWKRMGRYFVVIAFVVAAIFTPPDPLSQTLMAVPLTVLYFIGTAFAWIAAMLREGGRGAVARWLVLGTFVLFAASIGLASWVWTRGTQKPRAVAAVPATARMALRADPASAPARSILDALGSPTLGREGVPDAVVLAAGPAGRTWAAMGKGYPCDDAARSGHTCLLTGEPAGEEGADAAFDTLSRDNVPVSLVLLPDCLARLAPEGVGTGTRLEADLAAPGGGLATVTLRFPGDAAGRTTLATWVREARATLLPGPVVEGLSATPLGRTLAWTEGDLDVAEDGDVLTVTTALTAARAARIVAALARDAAERCGR